MARTLTGYQKETKMGLKPVMDNGYGGREYQLHKSRVRLPQPKKQYSDSAKKAMAARLVRARAMSPTMIKGVS